MGSCVSKRSHLKPEKEEFLLPEPIKRDQRTDLMVKFRDHQNNNSDDKMSKIYRMSYMSRDFDSQAFDFSDDLCELILSYLTIEQKVIFECVSKQWQKLIYNSIHRLEYPLNRKLFYPDFEENRRQIISRKFLRKCHFIEHLKVWPVLDTDIVTLLMNSSHHLKSIDLRLDNVRPIRRDVLCRFTENCGQTLERIRFNELNDQEFDSESGLSLLIVYSEYLLNIRSVSVSIDSDKCLKYFTLFADFFNERLNELELRLKFSSNYTQIVETFEQISRFTRLNTICLKLESESSLELDLKVGAELLAKNCLKLKNISLEVREQIHCSNGDLLKSLESLSYVQTLNLKIRTNGLTISSFESLKKFRELSELSLSYKNLNDEHLTDIHINCPKLKSIELKTLDQFSDNGLNCLSKLKGLEKIRIFCTPYRVYNITDLGVCHLINNCQKLWDIHFECGICLTQITFLTLNALADSSPKCRFRFAFCWKRTEDQNQTHDPWRRISAHELWPELRCLPENLQIVCTEFFVGKCATNMMTAIDKFEKQFTWIPITESLNKPNGKPHQYYSNGTVLGS